MRHFGSIGGVKCIGGNRFAWMRLVGIRVERHVVPRGNSAATHVGSAGESAAKPWPVAIGLDDRIHRNGSATEWWVAFFRPAVVQVAADLPSGFLAADRSNHDDSERVPFGFGFRTADESMDFVLISVHLMPGASKRERRRHELATIAQWIDAHDQTERDFIILGDMNIENAVELASATPEGCLSLNDECRPTNTNLNGPKPYDHMMFNTSETGEIDRQFDCQVVDLIDAMRDHWDVSLGSYPGEPRAPCRAETCPAVGPMQVHREAATTLSGVRY